MTVVGRPIPLGMKVTRLVMGGTVRVRLTGAPGPEGPAGPPGSAAPTVDGAVLRRQFPFTDPAVARPATGDAIEWLGATTAPPTNAIEGDIWTRRTGA